MNGFQDAKTSADVQNVNRITSIKRKRKKRKHEKLTQERLKEIVSYNTLTGVFVWMVDRPGKTSKKGMVAGSVTNDYHHISVDGNRYWSHRLAWLYIYGYMPENDIDHIDKDPGNNRIDNLREVSVSCNIRNSKVYHSNTSGVKGVFFNKLAEKWRATIGVDLKQLYLGDFLSIEDAVKARYNAEIKFIFNFCDSASSAKIFLEKNGLL